MAVRRTRDRVPNSSTHTTLHHSLNKARARTSHSPDSPRHQYSPSPSPHLQHVYYSAPIASAPPPTPRGRDRHQPATTQTPHHQAVRPCRYHATPHATSARFAGSRCHQPDAQTYRSLTSSDRCRASTTHTAHKNVATVQPHARVPHESAAGSRPPSASRDPHQPASDRSSAATKLTAACAQRADQLHRAT